ncbi:MAG: lysine transporter LysE [Aquimarina sp.]|nr:lysine transporter LysE [Aquimarina sp.]
MAFIEGYLVGLGMIIFIGPVFFLLLNSSVQYGRKAGVSVAVGIIVSDIFCVWLCHLGLSVFFNATENQLWIGITGGFLLFFLGIYYLIKTSFSKQIIMSVKSLFGFFIKGFSINFFNPFVFAVWIALFQLGNSKFKNTPSFWIFIMAILFGILTTDLLKVFFSQKLRNLLSEQRLLLFSKIIGLILIVFSIRVFYTIL